MVVTKAAEQTVLWLTRPLMLTPLLYFTAIFSCCAVRPGKPNSRASDWLGAVPAACKAVRSLSDLACAILLFSTVHLVLSAYNLHLPSWATPTGETDYFSSVCCDVRIPRSQRVRQRHPLHVRGLFLSTRMSRTLIASALVTRQ